MNRKSIRFEYIFIAIIIAASVFYLLFKTEDKIHYKIPVLALYENDVINRIDILKDNEKIILKKSGENWLIGEEEYPADKEKISKISDIISNLSLTTLVSRSKNYYLYELDKDKRIEVSGYINGQPVRKFDIGKTASTYDHTFVKIDGDPNIYHAKDSIRNSFENSIDNLRDKKVLVFNKDLVKELTITIDKDKYLFKKVVTEEKNGKKEDIKGENKPQPKQIVSWEIEGKKGNKKNIESLLKQISELECSKYIYDDMMKKDSKPIYQIRVKADKEYILKIYKKADDKSDYPAVTSAGKYQFFLSIYSGDAIMKKKEDLVK